MAIIKFKAKTKNCQLYVRAKLSFDDKVDVNDLDRFSRKLLKGFLSARLKKPRVYELTGPVGIPLERRLQNPITKFEFFFIIEQVVQAAQRLTTYQFSLNNVLWDVEHAYINEATKELHLIYLPLMSQSPGVTALFFMETIIYLTKPVADKDADFASRFMYFLRTLKSFDCHVIESYIAETEPKVIQILKKGNTRNSGYMTDKQMDYLRHKNNDDGDEPTGLLQEDGYRYDDEATGLLSSSYDYKDDDEATGLLQDDDATGILYDDTDDSDATSLLIENNQVGRTTYARAKVSYPKIVRLSTREKVEINKPVFSIGKDRSFVDFYISNNPAVSRNHASIVTRGQRYFVIDQNSKNRSYIDGQILPANQECEIFDGCYLRLADEEFVFYAEKQ